MIKQNWVFCCGAKRSGSTLQFNLVSSVLEFAKIGMRTEYASSEDFESVKEKYKDYNGFLVFKTHNLSDSIRNEILNNNSFAFYCYRDIRDVIVSYINKKWIPQTKEAISTATKKYLDNFLKWDSISQKLISRKYESFNSDLFSEVKFIAQQFGIELTESDVKKICEENSSEGLVKASVSDTKAGSTDFNSHTLLHKDHVFNGTHGQYLNMLSPQEIFAIEKLASFWLYRFNYELQWTNRNNFISYSQHMDDYIAWIILNKRKNGVVFEVGAFDGVHLSNSLSLSMLGWKSVCIEPNPEFYKHVELNRSESICLNYAVVGDNNVRTIDFYSEEIGVLSGCLVDSDDIKRRYSNRGIAYNELKRIVVNARTFNEIVAEAKEKIQIDKIDVLSIDVEGFEMEVLKGIDFKKISIELVIIEANNRDFQVEIIDFFSKNTDMKLLLINKQNLFFCSKRYLKKIDFDFAKCTQAYQFHPKGETFVIQSVLPTVDWKINQSSFIQKIYSRFFKK